MKCDWLGCDRLPRWSILLNFAPPRVADPADLEASYCYEHMAETMRDRIDASSPPRRASGSTKQVDRHRLRRRALATRLALSSRRTVGIRHEVGVEARVCVEAYGRSVTSSARVSSASSDDTSLCAGRLRRTTIAVAMRTTPSICSVNSTNEESVTSALGIFAVSSTEACRRVRRWSRSSRPGRAPAARPQ